MGKKDKVVKITEVEPKTKEIKPVFKEESELEREVEETEFSDSDDFAPSGTFQAPILSSGEGPQEVAIRPISATQERDDPAFSQTRLYSTTSPEFTSSQETRRYIGQEVNSRATASRESNITFDPHGPRRDFVGTEMQHLSDDHKRDYNKPLDMKDEKQRRKMPWEA